MWTDFPRSAWFLPRIPPHFLSLMCAPQLWRFEAQNYWRCSPIIVPEGPTDVFFLIHLLVDHDMWASAF